MVMMMMIMMMIHISSNMYLYRTYCVFLRINVTFTLFSVSGLTIACIICFRVTWHGTWS